MIHRWRVLVSLLVLVVATVQVGLAQSPAPSTDDLPPGVTWTQLGSAWAIGSWRPRDLTLARVTIAPGAAVPAHRHAGDRTVYVEQGPLSVHVLSGDLRIGADGDAEIDDVGLTRIVFAGDWVASDAQTVQEWRNPGDTPVVLLVASLDEWDAAPFDFPRPAPDPTPRPPVVHRQVLRGGTGDRAYRITIRDRSGHLRDARMPTRAELTFASGGETSGLIVGTWSRRGRPALVSWTGTICGPVVTIDIGADLQRIRIIDHSPGCDAAAVPHWVVLMFDTRAQLGRTEVVWSRAQR